MKNSKVKEIDFDARFVQVGIQTAGSNEGGYYQDKNNKNSNKTYYIKRLSESLDQHELQFFTPEDFQKKFSNRHRNRINNEYLALKLYELFNVPFPKNAEFFSYIKEGQRYYAIATEVEGNIISFDKVFADTTAFKQACLQAHVYFLPHCLFANYDVVGNGDNIFLKPDGSIFHVDPGAALLYQATGGTKKNINEFTGKVGEFLYLSTPGNHPTMYNPGPLSRAALVFEGVLDSPALLRSLKMLLAVDDLQIRKCVEDHGFDVVDGPKGQKRNKKIIRLLTERKMHLVQQVKEQVLKFLVNNIAQRVWYLENAGISVKTIECIMREFSQSSVNYERIWSFILNEITDLKNNDIIENNAKALCVNAGLPLTSVKIEPRIKNFRPGDELHNRMQGLQCIHFNFSSENDYNNFLKKCDETQIMGFWIEKKNQKWHVELFPGFLQTSQAFNEAKNSISQFLKNDRKIEREDMQLILQKLVIFPVHVQLDYLGLFYNKITEKFKEYESQKFHEILREKFSALALQNPKDEKVQCIVAKFAALEKKGIINNQHQSTGKAGAFFGVHTTTRTRETLGKIFTTLSWDQGSMSKVLACSIRKKSHVDAEKEFTTIFETLQNFIFCFSTLREADYFSKTINVPMETVVNGAMVACPKEIYFDLYIEWILKDTASSFYKLDANTQMAVLNDLKYKVEIHKYSNDALESQHLESIEACERNVSCGKKGPTK